MSNSKPRITEKQKKLFAFLRNYEKENKHFTLEELSIFTNYPLIGTVKAKMSRNEWSPFIQKDEDNRYYSKGVLNLSLNEFAIKISTKKRTSPYYGTKLGELSPESRNLTLISRNEFILAIELFNRPSTPNRLDAFLTHFISGFEKLLKAILIEKNGKDSIWRKPLSNKKTKSISEIASILYNENDSMRLNLEYLVELRNLSTHYILPELEPIASRYFQSAVFNYSKTFQSFANEPPIELKGIGLLSLIIEGTRYSQTSLKEKYGQSTAIQVKKVLEKFETKSKEINNMEFAIPIELSIGIVNKSQEPENTLANLSSSKPIYVQKIKDPKKTHPYMAKDLVHQIDMRLKQKYSEEKLAQILPKREKTKFNMQDFTCITENENWKHNSNKYHFDHGSQAKHTYSDECINFIINKIESDKEYLTLVKKRRKIKLDMKKTSKL